MALILCLETATSVCSVALMQAGKALAVREVQEGFRHAEQLPDFIREICLEAGVVLNQLDAVAVSGGPGSYTGLRIGVSMAKGICWSLDKPLIAIPTLTSMAAGAVSRYPKASTQTVFCPLLDARRLEVYTACYDVELQEIEAVRTEVITADSFSALSRFKQVVFMGDGMEKTKQVLNPHPGYVFMDDFIISAVHLGLPAEAAFLERRFVNTAAYEPFYFKEFVPGRGSVLPGT